VVVIKETSDASWYCTSNLNAMPTGSISNALGFGSQDYGSTSGSDPFSQDHDSLDTRYQVKQNPGASFTIHCSPYAHISGTGAVGLPRGTGYGAASVDYKASAEPLEIILSGGIGPKLNRQYLIGQQVTATSLTGGLTATSYAWDVSGGSPFKSYTPGQDTATFTELNLDTETGSSLTFHFKEPIDPPGKATISCITNLQVPPGALPTTPLTAIVSRKVAVVAPEFTFEAARGTVQFDDPNNPTEFRLDGAELYGVKGGCVWSGTVTAPPEFDSGGEWNFTQTVTPNRVLQSPQATHNFSYNGQKGLDEQFPYSTAFPADGTRHTDSDIPNQFIRPPFTNVKGADSFDLYMLYMPPDQGSNYVPLTQFSWNWKGEAAPNSSGGWNLLDADSGSFPRTGWPLHPKWTRNNITGTWTPPLPPRP